MLHACPAASVSSFHKPCNANMALTVTERLDESTGGTAASNKRFGSVEKHGNIQSLVSSL